MIISNFNFTLTERRFFYTVGAMKLVSLCIALVIALSLVSMGSPFLSFGSAEQASFRSLDVCHGAQSVISPELPCIPACSCLPLPVQVAVTFKQSHTKFIPLILAFQDERPPQA